MDEQEFQPWDLLVDDQGNFLVTVDDPSRCLPLQPPFLDPQKTYIRNVRKLCSLSDARLIERAFEQAARLVDLAISEQLGADLTPNRWQSRQNLNCAFAAGQFELAGQPLSVTLAPADQAQATGSADRTGKLSASNSGHRRQKYWVSNPEPLGQPRRQLHVESCPLQRRRSIRRDLCSWTATSPRLLTRPKPAERTISESRPKCWQQKTNHKRSSNYESNPLRRRQD